VKSTAEQHKRAAIYTRISNDPKLQGLGVARQLEDCAALAANLGWEVVAHFDDNDTSAYSGRRRHGFEALLEAMTAGHVDAILCWHTDRLYRSLKDLERLIDIAEPAHITIKTVQGGDLDLSTSAGRMVARILGSVARQESEHTGERRRRANGQKAEEGRWQTANRPFGYDMSGQPVPDEAAAYRQAVSDVLGGKSIQGVARDWNAAGLKTTLAGQERKDEHDNVVKVLDGKWSAPRVRRLLVNPRYAGRKLHNGKDVGEGNWMPLIDLDTHRGLVAYLSNPARIKNTSFERKYLGSGLYVCGKCGASMKAAMPGGITPTGRANRKTRAYVCRESAHVLRQGQPLDDFVTATLLERLSQPDAQVLLPTHNVDVRALQTERAALAETYDGLATLLVEGVLDGPGARRNAAELKAKIAVIDAKLADATRTSPAASLIAAGDKLWERWLGMSVTQRAQAVDELAVVTVKPCAKKGRGFDSGDICIEWRREQTT
jgi:site-specific DNA recombinase